LEQKCWYEIDGIRVFVIETLFAPHCKYQLHYFLIGKAFDIGITPYSKPWSWKAKKKIWMIPFKSVNKK